MRCSASAVRASSMLMNNCSALARTVAFSLRCLADDGPEEDGAILFSGTQVEGHHLLPRRHLARALRVGIHRHHSRRLGLSEPLWRFFPHSIVRVLLSLTFALAADTCSQRSLARSPRNCMLACASPFQLHPASIALCLLLCILAQGSHAQSSRHRHLPQS